MAQLRVMLALLAAASPCFATYDASSPQQETADLNSLLQLGPVAPDSSKLCAELCDGRLDYLAYGGWSADDICKVACHLTKNIFPNGTILAAPSQGTEVIHEYPKGTSVNIVKDGVPTPHMYATDVSINQNDYYYMWQRDAGLTMRTLLRVAKGGPQMKKQLISYAKLYHKIWKQTDPNTDCAPYGAGDGWCSILGEPKFFVNGSVFDQSWGRAQNDGPAINSWVFMELLAYLEKEGDTASELFNNTVADVIAAMNYVGGMGQDSTMDPWEMLYGQHYFDQALQWQAMSAATAMADRQGWEGVSNFALWVPMLRFLADQHWDGAWGAVRETNARPWFTAVGPKCLSSTERGANVNTPRTGPCELDIATIIGSLSAHGNGAHGGDPDEPLPPYDSRMLATAYHVVTTMADAYEVNQIDDDNGLPGVLIGRYPGDEYSGVIMSPSEAEPVCQGWNCGNAWFLGTHTLAEFIYTIAGVAARGDLKVDSLNHGFILLAIQLGLPKKDRDHHKAIPKSAEELAKALVLGGDGVLQRAKHHASEDLHMSEQIYRGNGYLPGLTPGMMVGSRDLSWSYASLLDALAARSEVGSKSKVSPSDADP